MKNFTKHFLQTFFAISISIVTANGQSPILTAANSNPIIGDSYTEYSTSPPPFSTIQLTGANQTWDFSNNTGSVGTTYEFVTPAATPNGSSFPNATIAMRYADSIYIYYNATANDLFNVGEDLWGSAVSFTDPYKYLSYPFAYQNSFIDTLIMGSQTNYITHTADGYGTLIMPYGTINNVLRHHEHWDRSTQSGTLPEDQYYWSLPGNHFLYICWYSISDHGGGVVDTSYAYINPYATGISESNSINNSFGCFPDPFSTQLTFTRAANEPTTVSLYNFLGQQVLQQTFTNSATINTEQLADGIYFYELKNTKGIMRTGKVVKQ